MPSEEVIARLRTEGEGPFTSAMNRAKGAVSGVGTGAEGSQKGLRGAARSMLTTAAAVGVTYKAYKGLKESINTAGDLAKSTAAFSRASGLDMKQSQAWVVTAKSRGIETRQLQLGMATLGRNLGALGGSGKASAAALQQLGVSQAALRSQPINQQMATLADAFAKMPDGAQKAALAQRLFGRSGQQLLPVLNGGSKALNEQLAAANKLVPSTAKNQQEALKLAKAQREWQIATMGLKVAIGNMLIPMLTPLVKALTPIIGFMTKIASSSPLAASALTGIAVALGVLTVAVKIFGITSVAALGWWLIPIAAGIAAIVMLITHIDKVKAALVTVWNWIKGNWPLLLAIITGPIGAAVLFIITNWSTVTGIFMSVVNAVKSGVSTGFNAVKTAIIGAINTAVNFVKARFNDLVGFITGLPGRIAGVASGMFNSVVNAAKTAAGWAWKQFNWLVGQLASLPGKVASALSSLAGEVAKFIWEGLPKPLRWAAEKVAGAFGTGGIIAAQQGWLGTVGGRNVLVGERGPEMLSLPSGSRVTPLPPPQLAASQLGAGGGTITVPVFLDRRQIAEAMGSYAADRQAAR